MNDTTHEAPERIVPSCVEALESYHQADMDGIMVLVSREAIESYHQADMDGIMVLVSREAIHQTIDAYWARVEACEELEAKLAKAVERFNEIRQHCANFGRGVPSIDERIVDRCEETAANAIEYLAGGNDE